MSDGESSVALSVLHAEARSELEARHAAWSQATLQDAIESMRRLGRWHLVRRGCRVPVHDLYCVSMGRQAERLARRFVAQGAASLSAGDPATQAAAVLSGQGCIEGLALGPSQADRVFLQGAFESPVAFLRRFEAELGAHLESLFEQHLASWFDETVDRVCASWTDRS